MPIIRVFRLMMVGVLVFAVTNVITAKAMTDSLSEDSTATSSDSTTKTNDATEIERSKAELLKKQTELMAEAAKKQAELKLKVAKQAAEVAKKRSEAKSESVKKSVEVESEAVGKSAELDKKRIEFETEFEKKKAELELLKSDQALDATVRCDLIETRIKTITTRHENNKSRNVTAYENMYTRLLKVAARFEAKGSDVSALMADLAVLNNKVIQLKSDHASYLTNLLDSRQYACGKSSGEFKTTLGSARDKMAVVKADIEDIKNFYQTTIKTDINTLKEQIKTSATETPDAASSSSSNGAVSVPIKP